MAYGQWKWNRSNQNLSKQQYVWGFGVFAWGAGMFSFVVLRDYLFWKVMGDVFLRPTPPRVLLELIIWLGAGWTLGLYGAPERGTLR